MLMIDYILARRRRLRLVPYNYAYLLLGYRWRRYRTAGPKWRIRPAIRSPAPTSKDSQYIAYLKKHGIPDISIGQSYEGIAAAHDRQPIDWFVYSSAVPADHPELRFCREQDIKTSKRDELLNLILQEKKLRLVAVAGTHGKTTTTALVVWLFKRMGLPVSYLLPAKNRVRRDGRI